MKHLLFILLVLPFNVSAQIIKNFAGGGASLGDGGLATAAKVTSPGFGSFDNVGNYYFPQAIGAPRIRRVDTSGIINTVAGNGTQGFSGDGGPATSAQFQQINGVTVDVAGNIYISDVQAYRIRKVDATTHVINTIAGTGSGGFSGDGGPAINAEIWPGNLCVDSLGNIYFIDHSTRIRKIDTAGIITTIAGTGTSGFSGDGGPAVSADINVTVGICLDANGDLLLGAVTRIRKVNLSTGVITTIAGGATFAYNGDDIPADTAHFSEYGICCDYLGNIFIADYPNNRIRKIDVSGIIHTVAGTGVAGYSGDGGLAINAQINHPEGVAADKCGNICIAENTNNRIRKVTFTPSCSPQDTTTDTKSVKPLTYIRLYPNPVRDEVSITSKVGILHADVLNLIGQNIWSSNCTCNSMTLGTGQLTSGIYYLRVIDQKGDKTVLRFIKQ